MRTFKNSMVAATKLLVVMAIICGVMYTGLITGIAQLFFHSKANGSLIDINGVSYGSQLLAQYYQDDRHLWGRMMLIDTTAFKKEGNTPLLYSFPYNASITSQDYVRCLEKRIAYIKSAHPEMGDAEIPIDLVTCSASGLDPDISIAAAKYQMQRLAKANNMTLEQVQSIMDRCTTHKALGILGEDTVNVLKVNLILDGAL